MGCLVLQLFVCGLAISQARLVLNHLCFRHQVKLKKNNNNKRREDQERRKKEEKTKERGKGKEIGKL